MQAIELNLINSSITVYSLNENHELHAKDVVVISSNNSLDLATVVKTVNVEPEMEFVEILRTATAQDKKQNCENCAFARKILPDIKTEANKLNLDMKIGFISTSLDRNKISVYYTAEDRVDFRELIKVLSNKYKARIEMRQIGNRDEAKQIGAIGICGKVTCCKQFLSDFDKVSIKMAKNQNISLNPNKINGMCGRLLCCFKYEDEYYAEMQKRMPKLNSTITTPDGKATVASVDYLRETITVNIAKNDSVEQKKFTLEEIENLRKETQIKHDKKHR